MLGQVAGPGGDAEDVRFDSELTALVSAALGSGGCRGWSLGVYNPDLDPGRRAGGQVVSFLAGVLVQSVAVGPFQQGVE